MRFVIIEMIILKEVISFTILWEVEQVVNKIEEFYS